MATLDNNDPLVRYATQIWWSMPALGSKATVESILAEIKLKAAHDKADPLDTAIGIIKGMGQEPTDLSKPVPTVDEEKPSPKSKGNPKPAAAKPAATPKPAAKPAATVEKPAADAPSAQPAAPVEPHQPTIAEIQAAAGVPGGKIAAAPSTAIVPSFAEQNADIIEAGEARVRALKPGESWRDVLGDKLGARVEIPWETVQEELLKEFVSVETASTERYTLRIRPGPTIACNSAKTSVAQRDDGSSEEYVSKYYIYDAEIVREKGAKAERIKLSVNATLQKKLPAFISQNGIDAWFRVKAVRENNVYRAEITKVDIS